MTDLKQIAPASGSTTYRYRDSRYKIVFHTSVPRSDDEAYRYMIRLVNPHFGAVMVERQVQTTYPHGKVTWTALPKVLKDGELSWDSS